MLSVLPNMIPKHEGLSHNVLAIFFVVDSYMFIALLYMLLLSYTFYCSPIHFIVPPNMIPKQEALSQNVPAIFFLVDSYTFYSSLIHVIAPVYLLLLSYTLYRIAKHDPEIGGSPPECSCYFLSSRQVYVLLLSYTYYCFPIPSIALLYNLLCRQT